MKELEIIQHREIDGISLFFDTVDYRTPHFHPEWELIWITDGQLTIHLGPDGCIGSEGDIFLFCPGKLHEFQKVGEGATFLCLQLSPQLFEKVYPGFGRITTEDFRITPYFSAAECSDLRSDLRELTEVFLNRPPFFEILCTGLCARLFSHILAVIPCRNMSGEELANADRRNARLERFIRFVDENYSHKIMLSDFAEMEQCSVSYLSRFLKSALNQSFQEYVNSVRFHSAYKLIAGGGMKMLDVCEESGFSDYRYFSAAFKKHCGMTPEEYSRQAVKPEDHSVRHSLHSLERFYTREQSRELLRRLRPV